jgi:hypothetical protein
MYIQAYLSLNLSFFWIVEVFRLPEEAELKVDLFL